MRKKVGLTVFLVLFFISCSEDSPVEVKREDPFIQVNAFYNVSNENEKHLDLNSNVFIYYGRCLWGIADYKLLDDGKFVSKDGTDIIIPEQQGIIEDGNGIKFKLLYSKKEVTIFVRSNYGNMLSGTCYPSVVDSAKLICNFNY